MVGTVHSPAEMERVYAIRQQVFVEEQKVPQHLERDEYDEQAHHWLLWDGNQAVATARLVRIAPQAGKVGRVAVLPAWRGRGSGRQLMESIHQFAAENGLRSLHLDAQLAVLDFYAGLGYRAEGEVFEDCGILHRRMTRWLD